MNNTRFKAEDYNNEVIYAINEIGADELAEEYTQIVECITGELGEIIGNTDFLNLKNHLSWNAYKVLRKNGYAFKEIIVTVTGMIKYKKLKENNNCIKTLVNWISLEKKRRAAD